MEMIGTIAIAAMLVEALTSACKPIWDEQSRGFSYGAVISLCIGVIIALASNLDIGRAVGICIEWPLLPQVITGVIISRGSNYVYDIMSRINRQAPGSQQNKKI